MSDQPVTIVIEGERPKSLNELLRMNRYKRNEETQRIYLLVRRHIDPNRDPFECRVDIFCKVFFNKNPYDSTNLALKTYEDGLKGWYIKDDDIRYVRRVTLESAIDRKRPRVEITLTPVEE